MADYKFYIQKVNESSSGARSLDSKVYDLESDFKGLKYKSLSGANIYGAPKDVYAETFAEDDKVSVHVGTNDARGQVSVTLNLYFLDPVKWGSTDTTGTPYQRMSQMYHSFVNTISGHRIIYWDTARNRYMYLYMDEAHTLSADKLIGLQYIEASIKFKSIFGRSFTNKKDITDNL